MRFWESRAGEALLYVLIEIAGDRVVALTSPPIGYGGGGELESGASVKRGEDTA